MKTFKTSRDAYEYSVINPLETVECKWYHGSGQLWENYFYVNGKQHGEYKSYWSNGQLVRHCFYVGGKRNGESKTYHNENGNLKYHYFYVNGEVFDVDHLRDGSYKSLCIKHTLFYGNLIDEDI